MNFDKVLKILLLPLLILIWGIGWTLYFIGDFLQNRSEQNYHKFLKEIKEGD